MVPGLHLIAENGGVFPHGLLPAVIIIQGVVFAYSGIELLGVAAGEAQDARKILPGAINGVMWRIGLFYVGSVVLLVLLMPWRAYKAGVSPFVTFFGALGLPGIGTAMNLVVLTAAMSSLNSGLYSTGRVLRSLAVGGSAPPFVSRMNAQTVPYGGIAVTLVVYLFGVVLNYLVPSQVFEIVLNIASLGIVSTWGFIVVCQMKLRAARRNRKEIERVAFPPALRAPERLADACLSGRRAGADGVRLPGRDLHDRRHSGGGDLPLARLAGHEAQPAREPWLNTGERRGDRGDRAEEDQAIVSGFDEAPPAPEVRGLRVDGIDHQCAAADERRGGHAALQSVLDQARADSPPSPCRVGGELAEKQARHWVGRLPGAHGAGHDARDDRGRRQAIIADNPLRLVNDEDGREALFLIGKGARLQPMIQGQLAARELREIMSRRQRLGRRERQRQPFAAYPGSQGAVRMASSTISGTDIAGPDNADMNSAKPSGLMRISRFSISTSSAARTAASRTKSVRDRPRMPAARSIIAMSASGRRIEIGCSLRPALAAMAVFS